MASVVRGATARIHDEQQQKGVVRGANTRIQDEKIAGVVRGATARTHDEQQQAGVVRGASARNTKETQLMERNWPVGGQKERRLTEKRNREQRHLTREKIIKSYCAHGEMVI